MDIPIEKVEAEVNKAMASETVKLRDKRAEVKSWFDSFPRVEGRPDMKENDLVEFKRRSDELDEVNRKYEQQREVTIAEVKNRLALEAMSVPQRGASFPGMQYSGTGKDGLPPDPSDAYAEARRAVKSVGRQFTESQEYKSIGGRNGVRYSVEIEGMSLGDALKTVLSTTAGFAPFNPRIDDVVPMAGRRPTVADLMPNTDTEASAIIYMEQTTRTNNAAPVAEGATKPESAIAWTQRTVPMEVIAHLLPVTEQQLEDVPGIRDTIDQEMIYLLKLAEEVQILTGDGVSPNLQGILTKTGVQTQAVGADPVPDAIYKAFTLVRFTGFAEPSGVVFHPNDWQAIRLLKTADGLYIWGSPAEAGPERIWGKPAVITTAMTENTVLTGDFQLYTRLYRKGGIRVEVGYVNDNFAKNLQTLRVEERAALVIRRAAAFCKVTGA